MEQYHYPLANLIDEIVSDKNMYEGYDYVISHLESKVQKRRYAPDKMPLTEKDFDNEECFQKYILAQKKAERTREKIIKALKEEIKSGTFRITWENVRTITVTDGPKIRDVQSPIIRKRIGCHCIMVIVEKYTYPTLIHNTGASIKGRGMHWLHHIIEDDIKAVPDKFKYFYKNDIRHYYDNIDQERMKAIIRQFISDPILLPMLDNFITLLPEGLSKGLRSSQTLGNLYLSPIHHKMLEICEKYSIKNEKGEEEFKYLYYNYCDDTMFASDDKKKLWKMRNIYVQALAELGLTVKENEAVRPLNVGLDMVGFVHYETHSLIRKRIKQNAARKLARIKSRKRRQQVIGAFKGMACHADCKNLYYKLTHHRMRKFGEMGIVYTPADGKKRFPGKVMRLGSLQNKTIEVHDYESNLSTSHGEDRYLVSFKDKTNNEWGKFFTSSEEMKNILDQISDMEDGFPFETVIQSEVFDGNKIKYKFT